MTLPNGSPNETLTEKLPYPLFQLLKLALPSSLPRVKILQWLVQLEVVFLTAFSQEKLEVVLISLLVLSCFSLRTLIVKSYFCVLLSFFSL